MKDKIESLQMLRCIAVALVIFIHTCNFVDMPHFTANSVFNSFFNLSTWGAIGVDLFFTISGFIMVIVTPAYINKGASWKDFLLKRAIRIMPLYYLISLCVLVVDVSKHAIPPIHVILKTIFFLPVFDRHVFTVPIVAVGWSLSYEMYFYLLITFFLILKQNVYTYLLLSIVLLAVIGAIFNPPSPLLKFLTSPLLIEFGFGIASGLLYKHSKQFEWPHYKVLALILIIIGAAGMLASVFINFGNIFLQEVVENNNRLAFYRSVFWGIPCGALVTGVVLMESIKQFKTPRLLVKAGDASYSAYLIHMKICLWYGRLFIYTNLGGAVFVLSSIVVCLAVSIVFYNVLERNLTLWVSKAFF
jgi:peptidoglycan/LPS O-acetylase OafA/YrhL